jgi:RNA polymerase sigma-70 factor (ECF subfamily)
VSEVSATVEAVYRAESRRILATLIRLLGDFDLAEDALHEAFRAALEQWPTEGVPENPRAWLVSAGRFKAIDALRKRARQDDFEPDVPEVREWEDDRLRLIFTCCHPALAPEARVALTLREVCGLTTEEIARAFLTTPAALAQRIVRAKAKIRDAGIPYQVPGPEDLPARLDGVLQVVYLVFNEGYSTLSRVDLAGEAIRLGRLLWELLPESEVAGLLALMLLQESRRAARMTADGDIVLLEDQDRSLWNRELIAEGLALLERTRPGPYALQAAIAGVHARGTDWGRIVELYDALLELQPSPVIELNRAVAVAMRDGPEVGIGLIRPLLRELPEYHLAHAALADLCRRAGRIAEARTAYERALKLARQETEKRFLEKRLRELSISVSPERLAGERRIQNEIHGDCERLQWRKDAESGRVGEDGPVQ